MKKLLMISILSVFLLSGCKDEGKSFIGKWQGEGTVYLTEENGSNYFMDIAKNGSDYLIDISFPNGGEKNAHLNYIAKLDGDTLVSGDGIDKTTLSIDKKTGELVNNFKEHIKYKKISGEQ